MYSTETPDLLPPLSKQQRETLRREVVWERLPLLLPLDPDQNRRGVPIYFEEKDLYVSKDLLGWIFVRDISLRQFNWLLYSPDMTSVMFEGDLGGLISTFKTLILIRG